MIDILKKMCEEQKNICIYSNIDSMQNFIYGKILAVNDEEVAVQMITQDGEDDGVSIFSVDDIFRIAVDGEYSRKMDFLLSSSIASYIIAVKNNDIMGSYLSYAKEKGLILSIELLDSGYTDITGYIESVDNDLCAIKEVDEYGCYDGISYIALSDITQITFLSEDEKRITRLFEKRKADGNC